MMPLTLKDPAFVRLASAAAPVPWTPAQISSVLRVWLDADDASTITLNGLNVSQWRDKSGLGNHYSQVVSAFQMGYSTNRVNGRAAVEADVGGEYMSGAASTALNGSGMSVMVVAQQNASPPSSLDRILVRDNSLWVGSWFLDINSASRPNTASVVFGDGSSWALRGTSATAYGTGTRLVGATVTAGGSATTYVDGTASAATSQSWANFTGAITLGHSGGGSQMFLGPICEALIMVDVLSQSDREKLEGYLAHRWWASGANPLPGGHPYKSSPPTV